MCGNYPNCNCPSCTQCQDCTQVTPTCNCTTTCTCSTEQFTEECPNGKQSTDCLIYTGDNLKDCQNNDYLFRGTNFNTFLSQLWETVKCAATATTDTIDYTGANIKDCTNTVMIVPTNTPVTTALNNIWNYIKCWKNDLTIYIDQKYSDLLVLINQKQPVWQGSPEIFIGSSRTVPYNNINTAINELAKYHFNTNTLKFRLDDQTHNLTSGLDFEKINVSDIYISSTSGNKNNCILSSTNAAISTTNSVLKIENVTLRSTSNSIVAMSELNGGLFINNCTLQNHSSSTKPILQSTGNSYINITNSLLVNNSLVPIVFVLSSTGGKIFTQDLLINNLGALDSSFYVAQVNSTIDVVYSNSVVTNVVSDVNIVFTSYIGSTITVLPYKTVSFNNIVCLFQSLGQNSRIIYRAENSSGTTLNTNVLARPGAPNSILIYVANQGSVYTTNLTATDFKTSFNVLNQSFLYAPYLNASNSLQNYIDGHSSVRIPFSNITMLNTIPCIFVGTASRLDIRNIIIIVPLGGVQLYMNANSRVYANQSNVTASQCNFQGPFLGSTSPEPETNTPTYKSLFLSYTV